MKRDPSLPLYRSEIASRATHDLDSVIRTTLTSLLQHSPIGEVVFIKQGFIVNDVVAWVKYLSFEKASKDEFKTRFLLDETQEQDVEALSHV